MLEFSRLESSAIGCCSRSTYPLAHFPFLAYLGFCEFAKAQAILGYAARGARLSGLPRDGSELDRPGAAEGAQDTDGAAACGGGGSHGVFARARDGGAPGARGGERTRGGGGGDGGGCAARDRSGAAVADRARLQLAGSKRVAGDPAAAGAGAAAGRRGDGGDGGAAGGGGGAAAADGGEGDSQQVGGDAGGGGGDAGSVAAAQGGVGFTTD